MNCHTETSSFTFPLHSSECNQNIQEYEKTAAKALQNINLMYNEIMAVKKYDLEIHDDLEEENASHSYIKQKHYIKTCCNFVKELCDKCERLISGCTSCNQCKCDSNKILKASSKEKSDNYPSSDPCNFPLKYTVPKPFSFCAKIPEHQKAKEFRICKMKQEIEKKVENELKVRANCKPVPKSTYTPKYSQIVQEMEQRKIKRKEKCQEILNNTKPFNLQPFSKNSVKAKSTTDLRSENTHFKAKPIPKHVLSNEISDKLKNKEEIRKMLISERAKQTIEKSSLPFSRKTIPNTKSCIDLFNLNTHDKKSKTRSSISEITKRLYVQKCFVAMENWNEKVSNVNADERKIKEKMCNLNDYMQYNVKQPTKKEEMPFMYFPVRMSNASMLRDKQIREKIIARKMKENINDEEVIKKRFNDDILHKLKNLVPFPEGEREIQVKVKSFRVSQFKRQQEYEKELEEIMKKVSEQKLLLEKQSKVKQINLQESNSSDKENLSNGTKISESATSDSDTVSSESQS